jgi:RNA polymerase sigma-70 factor (ECF subfamily)
MEIDWIRRQGRTFAVSQEGGLVAGDEIPSMGLEERQQQEHLRKALRQLTMEQQKVVVLRHGEGFSWAEAARLMDRSESAVKTLQYRAVRRL